VVTAPEKPGLVIPDETQLAAVIKAAPNKDLKAYVDTVTSGALLDPLPKGGSVVKTTTKEAIGITEWELSNGVKVVLKPTTFREDEIVFRATSPGGTSLAGDSDYIPANSAAQVLSAGGLGQFSAIDLRKVMTGKVANASAFIGETEEGLAGSGSRKDLETMFQLIYLRFTQPRADKDAFTVLSTQAKIALANQTAVPEFAFAEALTGIMGGNHLRRRITTPTTIDQWNLEKSLAFYRERFADASDFTFFFVGSFDLPTIKPLIEQYLGGLPSIGRKETWKDVGARNPVGVIERTVEKGIEPKSQTVINFTGSFQYDPAHRVALRAMTHVLQTRLLEALREELGGTYSVNVGGDGRKIPLEEYQISIRFGSDPQRVDALIKRVFEEIEKLKAGGPTAKEVEDEREASLREFETSSKQNGYLLTQIAGKYQAGEDVAGIWEAPELFKKLDPASIQEAAKSYLNTKNYVKVTLVPEKK
jgi:zinc protease